MIIFDLACSENHPFEGWFQSLSKYESQLEEGLICCPHCGSSDIHRVPSAVNIASSPDLRTVAAPEPAVTVQPDIRSAFQQLMSAILSNSEDVGKG